MTIDDSSMIKYGVDGSAIDRLRRVLRGLYRIRVRVFRFVKYPQHRDRIMDKISTVCLGRDRIHS